MIRHAGQDWRALTAAQLEEHLHDHEVEHCLARGVEFIRTHCAKVAEKRGRPAAMRLWNAIRAREANVMTEGG